MGFKLASEAAAAWAAVLISGGASASLTIYHYGQTNQQLVSMQQKQTETESRVAKHDDQIDTLKQLQAAQGQQLKDIAETVHDMHDNGVKRK